MDTDSDPCAVRTKRRPRAVNGRSTPVTTAVDVSLTLGTARSQHMPLDLLVLLCLAAMVAVSAAMIYGLERI